MGKVIDDADFGRLEWQGFLHGGWAQGLFDPRLGGFGAAVPVPEVEEDEDDEEDGIAFDLGDDELTRLVASEKSEDFVEAIQRIAEQHLAEKGGPETEEDRQGLEVMRAAMGQAREQARALDADDGSLDDDVLRRAGRMRLVVRGKEDEPPADAQRAAWRAFRDDPAAMDRVLAFLLPIYQRQRPARLKWWDAYYGDDSAPFLPAAATPDDLRPLLYPVEVRVQAENKDGPASVALKLDAAFDYRGISVLLIDGRPAHAERGTDFDDHDVRRPAPAEDVPPFGLLRAGDVYGFDGTYKTKLLHGDCSAGETRYHAEKYPQTAELRESPSWDVIDGTYPLSIDTGRGGTSPDDAQADTYRAFMADQEKHERQVLAAIAGVVRDLRDDYIKGVEPREVELKFPPVEADEDVLRWVTFGGVHVGHIPDDAELKASINPATGQPLKRKPKLKSKPASGTPGLTFTFYWDNEHPLGVAWRNGEVIYAGDVESAADAAAGR